MGPIGYTVCPGHVFTNTLVLYLWVRPGAYLRVEHLKGLLSGRLRLDWKKLAKDKPFSLVGSFKSYEKHKVLRIRH